MKSITLTACLISLVLLSACDRSRKAAANNSGLAAPTHSRALAFQADPEFGAKLHSDDRAALTAAENKALDYGKSGEQIAWTGISSETSGTVVAQQPFRVGDANCRRFKHKLLSGVGTQLAQGTACKRSDGAWKLVQ